MKKLILILIGMLAGISLVFGFLWVGALPNVRAERNIPLSTAVPVQSVSSGETAAGWQVSTYNSNDELPPASMSLDVQAPNALPTSIPGETLVYFIPTDSDATATVLFLLNTDAVQHTVALRGYTYSGVLGYSLNIDVPATSILRLVSDSVVAAPPPSWATPAPIVTNFTDFTYFASVSLPKGVKVEGFTLYNPGTGTIDPRLDQGEVPLRFSTDPATVFIPSVRSGQ